MGTYIIEESVLIIEQNYGILSVLETKRPSLRKAALDLKQLSFCG